MEKRKILIGGAWPYANNSLHLGHLAGLISGDFLARYHRQVGDSVMYVSGTDCHGTPITERAKRQGISPKQICEHYHEEFTNIFNKMNFSYDLYTKTASDFHKQEVMKVFKQMYDNGYIYEKLEQDNFCPKCNKFLADRELILNCPDCGVETKGDQCDCGYVPTKEDLKGSKCAECGTTVIEKENKNLYIALSKLQDKIAENVEANKHKWRKNAQNETDKYLKQGLPDRAVTRDLNWGVDIPVDGYEDKKMYVWIDAVLGYLTATKKYCTDSNLNWEDWWKNGDNQKMYMVHGKDNITFHSIIFPGLLLSIEDNYKLPDTIVSSEYLNFNEQKFSKSKGIGLTIEESINLFNVDTLRFHLIKNGPERKDTNFTTEDYLATHNEITNKFGNFVNRTLSFKGITSIPNGKMDEEFKKLLDEKYTEFAELIEKLEFRETAVRLIALLDEANKYYDTQKPWIQAKEDLEGFNNTIYTCANIIANLSNLFEPFMPETCSKVRKYLNLPEASWNYVEVEKGLSLENIEPLFARMTEKELAEKQAAMEEEKKAKENLISIEDFAKVELTVGKVVACEKVEKSEKLLKLQVDLGKETRTIVSGIAPSYNEQNIIGKLVAVITNLKPAKLMGIESNGMLLAAKDKHSLKLVTLDGDITPGTRIS